jgi:aminoglycoside/choline kinase family phosphotransferase
MKELVAWVEQVRPSATGGTWEPIDHGGSDRAFWRGGGAASGLVASFYGASKAESARYADCAVYLGLRGVRVPAVLGHDGDRRFLLLEDAGREDLWSRRHDPWEVRRDLYTKALEQAARLHALDGAEAEAAGVLCEPFGLTLYQWEQDYFFEHFLGRDQAEILRREVPLQRQAEELAGRPRVIVHRDLQSQNVMVSGDEVVLIDFQGMRAGVAAYDVASLLYDPYVEMSPAERAELAAFYVQHTGGRDSDDWSQEWRAAARQRLMQALGAYGFLGRRRGKVSFLQHIPSAARRLAGLCREEEGWAALAEAVEAAAGPSGA